MAVTDPIADYLTRLRNAMRANHRVVDIPASGVKKEITKILFEKGYMEDSMYIESNFGEREPACANTLRSVLGISSRSEMKTNSVAREKFKSISEEFVRWKQGRAQ